MEFDYDNNTVEFGYDSNTMEFDYDSNTVAFTYDSNTVEFDYGSCPYGSYGIHVIKHKDTDESGYHSLNPGQMGSVNLLWNVYRWVTASGETL